MDLTYISPLSLFHGTSAVSQALALADRDQAVNWLPSLRRLADTRTAMICRAKHTSFLSRTSILRSTANHVFIDPPASLSIHLRPRNQRAIQFLHPAADLLGEAIQILVLLFDFVREIAQIRRRCRGQTRSEERRVGKEGR